VRLNLLSCRRCTTAAVLENIGSTDKLEGFDELKEEDQDLVRKAIETKELRLPEDVAEAQEKVRDLGVLLGCLLELQQLRVYSACWCGSSCFECFFKCFLYGCMGN
jgi:hypothetical protein